MPATPGAMSRRPRRPFLFHAIGNGRGTGRVIPRGVPIAVAVSIGFDGGPRVLVDFESPISWQWPPRFLLLVSFFLPRPLAIAYLWKSCVFFQSKLGAVIDRGICDLNFRNLLQGKLLARAVAGGRQRHASPFGPNPLQAVQVFGRSPRLSPFPHFVLSFSSCPPFLYGTAVLLSFGDVLLPYEYGFAMGFGVPGELDFLWMDRKNSSGKSVSPWGATLS